MDAHYLRTSLLVYPDTDLSPGCCALILDLVDMVASRPNEQGRVPEYWVVDRDQEHTPQPRETSDSVPFGRPGLALIIKQGALLLDLEPEIVVCFSVAPVLRDHTPGQLLYHDATLDFLCRETLEWSFLHVQTDLIFLLLSCL